VGFPCTVFGVNAHPDAAARPWKLVDRLKGFNWLNYYGDKFSTSQKRGVFADSALEILPADVWRWRLMSNAPESSDATFTWEELQFAINSDLANVFGNFVNRITRFCAARFESVVPDGGAPGAAEAKLFAEFDRRFAELTAHHEAMEFRKAAAETRALWALGNEYLQEAAPWTAIKTDRDAAAVGVRTGLNLCAAFALIAAPFMPTTAATILDALGVPDTNRRWPEGPAAKLLDALPRGLPITPPDVLFRKIEDEDVAAWKARFGGAAGPGP
jgi:methionyl-tRNA synthetase